MRQKVRRIIIFSMFFLFPLTFNYLSPYVSLNAAFMGLIAGSVIVFAFLFLLGILLGRAWCAWFCPVAGLSEVGAMINDKAVNVKKLAFIRYSIFGIWFAVMVTGFVLAGGIKGFDPLHLTENIVSIDEPYKFINYYMVLIIFVVLTITIGKRGACHSICWMEPFLTAGELVGRALHLPQLKIRSIPSACVNCEKCSKKCPMSIDVSGEIKSGGVKSLTCIRCGECVDGCPKKVLCYSMKSGRVTVEK